MLSSSVQKVYRIFFLKQDSAKPNEPARQLGPAHELARDDYELRF